MTIARLTPNGPDIALQSFPKVVNLGDSGAAKTVDWSRGPLQQIKLTVSGSQINVVGSLPAGESCRVMLMVQQDAVGGKTPSLSGVQAPTGGLTWSAGALAIDVLEILWDGVVARGNFFGKGY